MTLRESRYRAFSRRWAFRPYTRADVSELNRLARERMRAAGALGPEHQVATEEGVRAFAAGDRLMFRRNERGLGAGPGGRGGVAVKNGTLGTVLAMEAGGERLTVRLDGPEKEGVRDVTFYLRDYGHVDHGYAATTHKAQGVTVDRAHVLASRHMDRHAAYVALTRHRDGVALHWSRDELGSREGLARTLGRERAKDTSLDYVEALAPERERVERGIRSYAERRGLDPLRPESEIAVQQPAPTPEASAPKRGMFAGLRLGTGRPVAERAREIASPVGQPPTSKPAQAESALSQQVGRFAAAWEDALRMRRQDLPILPHQHGALNQAQALIEAERPEFTKEVAVALRDDPGLGGPAAAGAAGRAALIAAAEVGQARRQEEARRERVLQAEAARRAELDPVRERLLGERLEAWWRSEKPHLNFWERRQVPAEQVERARAVLKREIGTLPDSELRRVQAAWEREAQRERAAPRPRSGPSMGR